MGFGSDKTGFYKPSAVTVTASGNPLTLQNAKRLRKLTIYGNSVQDGTPSPDAPVEVQLCGDKTGNLIDVSNFTSNSNGYVENGSIYVTGYPYQPGITPEDFLEMTGLKEGDTFTSVADYTQVLPATNQTKTVQFFKKASAPEDISTLVAFGEEGAIITRIIPAGFNSDNFYPMYIYCGTSAGEGVKAIWSNFAIYKGSYTTDTLPAYEPCGYKVSGRAEGLNLLDTENIIENTEDTTVKIEEYQGKKCLTWIDGSNTSKQHFMQGKFKENTQYTFRFSGYSINHMMIYIVYTDGSNEGMLIKGDEEWSKIIFQSASGKSIDYWRGWHSYTQKVAIDIDSSMIIEGSYTATTIPPYEPYQPPQDFAVYLPEQIAKVGDVADEVVVDMEKQTAELKKNVGSIVADGDESWMRGGTQYDTVDYTNRFSYFYDIHGNYQTPGYFSNRFERKLDDIWNNPNSEAFNINNNQLHLSISNTRLGITADDESADRTTKFKAWLNDNNVTVYAPLAEPVTTDITSLQQWDAMPQVSGTVTLTLSAEVEPSGAEAVYTASKRPKAQAALLARNTIPEEQSAEQETEETEQEPQPFRTFGTEEEYNNDVYQRCYT